MTAEQPIEVITVPSTERRRLLNMAVEACQAHLDDFGVLDEDGWGWTFDTIDEFLRQHPGLRSIWLATKVVERAEQLGVGHMAVRKKALIPAELRWEVWERDNFTCQHCGSRRHLSVDHIVAESKGGTLCISNLQTLCKSCNSRKGARE